MIPQTARSAIEVIEVSPLGYRDECCAVLNATRDRQSDASRFDWLYLQNPDGNAIVWILRDGETGEVAGFTAAIPRRMWVHGAERMCWIGSDFSVLPQYRTLGLAVKLRRAAKIEIDAGRAAFLYAHPNDRMAVIHSRVGHSPVGNMIRLARPLRVGPLVAERVSSRAVGLAAGAILDPAIRWTDSASWSTRKYEFLHLPTAAFDSRFDDLFTREGRQPDAVIGVRDSTYLNWRYAANPCYRSEVLLALRRGELAGFAVFVREGESMSIKDIFPTRHPGIVGGLLQELRRFGYRSGLQSVSMTLLESNPIVGVLRCQGFRQRAETSQMFAYSPPDRPWAAAVVSPDQWRLTVGDRDL
jgi:hypothetical protein